MNPQTGGCRPLLETLELLVKAHGTEQLAEPLIPAFSSEHLEYFVDASFWATQVRIEFTHPPGSSVLVDGGSEASGSSRPLEIGENLIRVIVATGSESTEYDLSIRRRAPTRIVPRLSSAANFGHSLAVSGDLLAVGAPGVSGERGTVHLFRRLRPGFWEELPINVASAGALGISVGLDGPLLVSGAQTFGERQGTVFFHQVEGPTAIERWTFSGEPGAEIGAQVAISGNSAVVTSDNFDAVHTFSRGSSGNWQEDVASPLVSGGPDFIEASVALDGEWLVIGSHNASTPAVILYTRSSVAAAWSPPSVGDVRLQASGLFADSVSLSGDTLAVNGQPVRVFERGSSNRWSNRPLAIDSLGPVVVRGDALAVGSPQDDVNILTGAEVMVFRRKDSAWQLDELSPLPAPVGLAEQFGRSIALSEDAVFVGAPADGEEGAVYVYE